MSVAPVTATARRAQGLVEFALILPILILMFLIVIDFGRLFMSYVTLTEHHAHRGELRSLAPGNLHGRAERDDYNAIDARRDAGPWRIFGRTRDCQSSPSPAMIGPMFE